MIAAKVWCDVVERRAKRTREKKHNRHTLGRTILEEIIRCVARGSAVALERNVCRRRQTVGDVFAAAARFRRKTSRRQLRRHFPRPSSSELRAAAAPEMSGARERAAAAATACRVAGGGATVARTSLPVPQVRASSASAAFFIRLWLR